MIRYTVKQVKSGWIVYDNQLFRPIGDVYRTQLEAQVRADRLN